MENSFNHHYDLTLRVLTPLHIGGTPEKHLAEGLDYMVQGGRTYFIDLKKLCNHVKTNADEVAMHLKDPSGLKELIHRKGINIREVATELSTILVESEIKTFVKNGMNGKPYIPGSSVKGAIRSWVAASLGSPNKNGDNLLGRFSSDIFRHIKVGDGQAESIEYQNAKTFNLQGAPNAVNWIGGWKHEFRGGGTTYFDTTGFVFTYECLPIGTEVSLSLKITSTDTPYWQKLKKWNTEEQKESDNGNTKANPLKPAFDHIITANPLATLFKIINDKTRAYIKREIAFFDRYKVTETPLIVEELTRILNLIPTDNRYAVFRMAHGSGFHSMTGDWQYADHDVKDFWKGEIRRGEYRRHSHEGKKKYKSRKLIFMPSGKSYRFYPMGFVMWGNSNILPEKEPLNQRTLQIVTESAPLSPPEIKPSFHKGSIKDQTELDAVVVSDGLPNKVETYLNEPLTVTIPLNGYASAIPQGKVLRVRVIQMDKSTGKPKMVKFQDFKK